ncbi:efflux RND transporter permease subunit [Pontivivens insulae]|uniref:Multidrug resistance protein MexB n=1 Tax=Pontivivens insulae TaxID=1639689 RepID=A0A2R8A761_9RHOB|nr:efflux RND transporter permease subunit [Pontivivens insulae]RED18193.1 multidrug efflux pump subunit AcrB [Pontivivens insulae]SPF28091.1 Multidrug resistance protein MexB [Pontivivens insulae]
MLRYFVQHRTAANLLLVVMLALGVASLSQIRSQFFPDVVVDSVSVSVNWEGAGPEDVDDGVIAPLDPVLLAVEGVIGTSATAREGGGNIRMEFEPGWDMARAAADVETAIGTVTTLPDGADDPVIRRGQWRDRVTNVVITGPVEIDQLARYADEMIARLFREGITRTTVNGIAAPSLLVTVQEADLVRNDTTLSEIARAISAASDTDPAGEVAGGAARLRTGVERRSIEDVGEIRVRTNPDGSLLLVRDVATLTDENTDRAQAFRVGGNPAVQIRVDRADTGDAIDMQAAVEAVAAEMGEGLPEGVEIVLTNTRAEAISGRLDLLIENGLIGLALVVGLLFLFLSARTAFWVAAGIPVAMIATIALMFAFGITINMISLFALIICLGIVVDDAIVVGEHADYRYRYLGESASEAATNAAKRMSLPVLSATITTIIAFAALTTVGGRFGSLIADIPFTVAVVLAASLVECFLILPAHMRHALSKQSRTKVAWYDLPSHFFNKGFDWFKRVLFRPFMRVVFALRYPVIAGAVGTLLWSISLFYSGEVTWRFFNAPEQSELTGNIAMMTGTTRDETEVMVAELQRAVTTVGARLEAEHGTNPIVFALAQIGGNAGRAISGSDQKDRDQLGAIAIEIIDADLRPYSSRELQGMIEEEIRRHPKLETLSFRTWGSGPGGDGLSVQFTGAEAEVLKAASGAFQAAVQDFEVISAVEDNLPYDKTEFILDLTPRGAALGFTTEGIGQVLRQRLGGIEAARFPVGVRTGTITVALPDSELTADFISTARLQSPAGTWVPLSEIVSVQERLGFSTVLRENGLRVITVSGQLSEDDPGRAAEVTALLEDEIVPQIAAQFGVEYLITGLAEQERDFLNDAMIGFMLCLLGIYLTLCWIFSSWLRPLAVMVIIPFGLIGTIWGHAQWDVPLSLFTVVGLLGMTGIIINDSIVLITTIDEYAKTRGLKPALIDAVTDRLRPVLLTTLTTVLGLTPLLFETSLQAQFLKPTVITLAYGLAVGMFVVLLIVPAIIGVQRDVGRLTRSTRRALKARHMPGRVTAVVWFSAVATLALTIGTVALSVLPDTDLPPILQDRGMLELIGGLAVALLVLYTLAATTIAVIGRSRSIIAAE